MDVHTDTKERKSVFLKMIEDKKAIADCINKGGNLQQLAKERRIRFAKPI